MAIRVASPSSEFVDRWPCGRTVESRRLEQCIGRVRAGEGDACALVGVAGVGVTTLLDALAAQARGAGIEVVRARGRRAEQEIHTATLSELAASPLLCSMRDLLDDAGRQPLLRVGNSTVSALAASLIEATVPPEVAVPSMSTVPIMLIVDDAQFVDPASLQVLLFVAHRVRGRALAIVLGGRHVEWSVDDGGLERLEVGGLDRDSVGTIAEATSAVTIPADVADLIHERTGGHPAAVRDLVQAAVVPQLDGTDVFPLTALPGPTSVAEYVRPLRRLDERTREALCVVAATPTGRVRTISGALEALGEPLERLEPAEALGVVTVSDGVVEFDHPLRRGAVVSPARRSSSASGAPSPRRGV